MQVDSNPSYVGGVGNERRSSTLPSPSRPPMLTSHDFGPTSTARRQTPLRASRTSFPGRPTDCRWGASSSKSSACKSDATARVTVGPLMPVCRAISARDSGPAPWTAAKTRRSFRCRRSEGSGRRGVVDTRIVSVRLEFRSLSASCQVIMRHGFRIGTKLSFGKFHEPTSTIQTFGGPRETGFVVRIDAEPINRP